MTVGDDVEAALAEPVEERSIVDPVLQLERTGRAVAVEDEEPDVPAGIARPARIADRRDRPGAPAESGGLGGYDRDEREHDEDRGQDVEAARHARRPGGPDPAGDR